MRVFLRMMVILEAGLEEFDDVVFISEAKDIGNGLWEIVGEGDNVVYYFEDDFELGKVEKLESLLFSDEVEDSGFMITGFFVGMGDSALSGSSVLFFVGFLFMGYFGFLIFGRVRLESWKSEPNVVRILDLIEDTRRFLKENNVEGARDCYLKMNNIYSVLPEKTKEFFYKEISRVRLAIDKKDVLNLVREYEKAKDEFRRDDAVLLHRKINNIYKKLPKKFQERVYTRLIKKEI